jgi:hypothetical protein
VTPHLGLDAKEDLRMYGRFGRFRRGPSGVLSRVIICSRPFRLMLWVFFCPSLDTFRPFKAFRLLNIARLGSQKLFPCIPHLCHSPFRLFNFMRFERLDDRGNVAQGLAPIRPFDGDIVCPYQHLLRRDIYNQLYLPETHRQSLPISGQSTSW